MESSINLRRTPPQSYCPSFSTQFAPSNRKEDNNALYFESWWGRLIFLGWFSWFTRSGLCMEAKNLGWLLCFWVWFQSIRKSYWMSLYNFWMSLYFVTFLSMSTNFVIPSDFMGLVAKKMQEKKRKSRIFYFLGKVSWGRKWRTHVLSSSKKKKEKKKKN